MSTETQAKPKQNGAKKVTPKQEAPKQQKETTPPKTVATPKDGVKQLNAVLKLNGKTIVKRLQHAGILAKKFEGMSERYDDLTHFIAGKDAENSTMKFATEGGYSFTLSNPATISKVLELVEREFSQHLENAEKELITYQVH